MIFIRFVIAFVLLSSCISVFAQAWDCTINPNETRSAEEFLTDCSKGLPGIDPSNFGNTQEGTRDQIIKIVDGAISFGALLAIGALVWSGLQYTKAYGEDEKLKKAKTTGIYSLIGLILLLVSFGLVDIFINFIYTVTGN